MGQWPATTNQTILNDEVIQQLRKCCLYTNNSALIPVPNDDRFPAQPEEKGMQFNLSIGYKFPPLCVAMSPGCLAFSNQNWMWTVPSSSNDSYEVHNVFSSNSFQIMAVELNPHEEWRVPVTTKNNTTKGLPDCSREPTKGTCLVNSIIWNDCNAPKPYVVLRSLVTGAVIDWAPRGYYWRNYSGQNTQCSEFNYLMHHVQDGWQSCRLREWVSPSPFRWMDSGVVPPRPKTIHPMVTPRTSSITEISCGHDRNQTMGRYLPNLSHQYPNTHI